MTQTKPIQNGYNSGAYGPEHHGGSPVSMHVYVKESDATCRPAFAAGAKSLREPTDQPKRRSNVRRCSIRLVSLVTRYGHQ
jgi:hypothetical protein